MMDILTRLLPQVYASSPTAEEVDDAHQWAAEKSNRHLSKIDLCSYGNLGG